MIELCTVQGWQLFRTHSKPHLHTFARRRKNCTEYFANFCIGSQWTISSVNSWNRWIWNNYSQFLKVRSIICGALSGFTLMDWSHNWLSTWVSVSENGINEKEFLTLSMDDLRHMVPNKVAVQKKIFQHIEDLKISFLDLEFESDFGGGRPCSSSLSGNA